MTNIESPVTDAARARLEPYAWPGGYPVMYMASDGWREEDGSLTPQRGGEAVCCARCAASVAEWPDLIVTGSFVHYEGAPEMCEWCNGETPSAYGPEAEEGI